MASAAMAAASVCPWGLDARRGRPGGTCRFVQGALHTGSCYLSCSIRERIPVTAFGCHICDTYCLEPPHGGPHAGRTLSAGRLSTESQATPKAGPRLQSRIVLLTLLTSDGCVTGRMGRGSPVQSTVWCRDGVSVAVRRKASDDGTLCVTGTSPVSACPLVFLLAQLSVFLGSHLVFPITPLSLLFKSSYPRETFPYSPGCRGDRNTGAFLPSLHVRPCPYSQTQILTPL